MRAGFKEEAIERFVIETRTLVYCELRELSQGWLQTPYLLHMHCLYLNYSAQKNQPWSLASSWCSASASSAVSTPNSSRSACD